MVDLDLVGFLPRNEKFENTRKDENGWDSAIF